MNTAELAINEKGTFHMLLEGVREIQGRNGAFCVLTLKPGKGEPSISAKMWRMTREKFISKIKEMTPVSINITADEYNGERGYIVNGISPDNDGNVDEFIDCSDVPPEKLYNSIISMMDKKYAGSYERWAVERVYDINRDKLMYWPGAIHVHHNYKGGLLQHSASVAFGCERLSRVLSPQMINSISRLNNEDKVRTIIGILQKHSANDSHLIKLAVSVYKNNINALDYPFENTIISLMAADRLCAIYGFLNKDVLFAAVALRGISSICGGQDLAKAVGRGQADLYFLDKSSERLIFKDLKDTEKWHMLKHCLIVDAEGARTAAIPEAFLVLELERLAGIAIQWKDNKEFSESAMVCAAALHDIGKLKELDSNDYGVAEYDIEGNLFGHTSLSLQMVMAAIADSGNGYAPYLKMLHCIAAHHGKPEWDALAEPLDEEAEILVVVDYIDSRLDIYHRYGRSLNSGDKDESMRKYLGNVVYKPAY